MRSAPKYLLVALALAALAIGGTTPMLAQSVCCPDASSTDRYFAVPVSWGHHDNYAPDDNPRGQQGSYSPGDH
jgi:hypothetical protein